MLLSQLFKGAPEIEINQLSCDSRVEMDQALFFCVSGIKYNGHDFIKEAIENGAKAIVYDEDVDTHLNAIFIKVKDVLDALNKASSKFYGYPGKKLRTYVTSGCYGKRAVTSFIQQINSKHEDAGYISSLGIKYKNKYSYSNNRTLTVLDNQKCMTAMVNENVKSCAFESTVKDLSYKKLNAVYPNYFIYTSTSYESRQYRELNKDYKNALLEYELSLPEDTTVILNSDDKLYEFLTSKIKNRYMTFGRNENSDFIIKNIVYHRDYTEFSIVFKNVEYPIVTRLLGLNNIYYLTAAIAALSDTYNINDLISDIAEISPIQGYMCQVDDTPYNIIIDRANTFDMLQSVFDWAKAVTNKRNKIVTILSISYSDDKSRLESLVSLCENNTKILILTEGDSFGKDMRSIFKYVEGLTEKSRCLIIEDRVTAIESGIDLLSSNDTLLILGKGSQNFLQDGLGNRKYEGDLSIAEKHLERRGNENEIEQVY